MTVVAGAGPVTLVHLWLREQVLVLPAGNPERIQSVSDLAGCRLAWRDSGTGSRLLLERLLRDAHVDPAPDRGGVAESHLAVAITVVTGAADAGLCARAAAESVGADWLPVTVEPFELAIRADALEAARGLLAVLDTPPSALGFRRWPATTWVGWARCGPRRDPADGPARSDPVRPGCLLGR